MGALKFAYASQNSILLNGLSKALLLTLGSMMIFLTSAQAKDLQGKASAKKGHEVASR
jgi:hypothetical protein